MVRKNLVTINDVTVELKPPSWARKYAKDSYLPKCWVFVLSGKVSILVDSHSRMHLSFNAEDARWVYRNCEVLYKTICDIHNRPLYSAALDETRTAFARGLIKKLNIIQRNCYGKQTDGSETTSCTNTDT